MSLFNYSMVFGDPDRPVRGPSPLFEAGPQDLSFCKVEGEEAISLIKRSGAGFLFVHESVPNLDKLCKDCCIVAMKNPRLGFIRCLNAFFAPSHSWNIHPTAVISKGVIIPDRISVGAQAVVGQGVVLGEGSIIGPRVFIMDQTIIGKEAFLQSGAIIGCDGQGFERNEEGRLERFPQMGRVVLGNRVEVGSNSTIVRGALPGVDTIIGKGTKIGHLVDIGKNVKIGEHCLVSAGAVLCGSVRVGDYAWLAPGCVIRQKVVIGRKAVVGLGSVVVSDVPEGLTVAGVPAKPLR